MTDLVSVWIVPVDVPPDTEAKCLDVLGEGERARAAAFLSPRDRQRFTVAHGALRLLAGHELGTRPAALTWLPGPNGKPELAPPWSGLHTSLSHSGDMIAVAISTGRPVGVDIQHLVPGLDPVALSARFFPPDEHAYVAAGPDQGHRAHRFAQLWARKEAVVKYLPATGLGIRRHVDGGDPDADQIGHDRTSAIRAARRRTPSSIWPVASALHDSRIAWLPPPSR